MCNVAMWDVAMCRVIQWQFRQKDAATWHGTLRLPDLTELTKVIASKQDKETNMARNKFPQTNTGATERKEMSPEQHQHFRELVNHTIDNTMRAGHGGHMLGKAGPGNTGHVMPKSDAHLQQGSYLPQNVANQFSDSGSADADDVSTGASDYGVIDKG